MISIEEGNEYSMSMKSAVKVSKFLLE